MDWEAVRRCLFLKKSGREERGEGLITSGSTADLNDGEANSSQALLGR